MQAGLLRHRVKLQALSVGQDETGQPLQTWVDVATVWADIRYPNGLETVKTDMPVGITRASIRIRYRAGLAPTLRALHGADIFDIKAVLPDRTNRHYLDLAAEKGANLG